MRIATVLRCSSPRVIPAAAHGGDLYVNPAQPGCSDTAGREVASNPATPWCSPAPALGLARPATRCTSRARPTHAQLRPLSSGTPAQPIVYLADGPVTISAPAGTVSVMLTGVHDIVLRGFTVLAAAPQAVWVDDASRILLDRVDRRPTARGMGVQIKGGTAVTIAHSRLINNARAGLLRHEPRRAARR